MSEPAAPTTDALGERIWRRLLPAKPDPLWARIGFGALCGGVALLVRLPIEFMLAGSLPFILVFPAVTIAAVRGGAAASTAAALVTIAYFAIGSHMAPRFEAARGLSLLLFAISTTIITLVARELRLAVDQLRGQEQALRESDARLRLLIQELEHRMKNSLSLAGALVKLTSRHSDDLADFRKRFEPRLQALAKAQTLLTLSHLQTPDLQTLVEETLAPFLGMDDALVAITPGPPFAVPSPSAVSLTLVLHELATNALKHGALSVPGGRVDLSWTLSEGGAELSWCESGGPPVVSPHHTGFGTELFRVLGQDAIRLDRQFDSPGVSCRIELGRQ